VDRLCGGVNISDSAPDADSDHAKCGTSRCYCVQVSLAALTGAEVDAFRLEVARRMRTERWNESIPWSREAANKVIMVSAFVIFSLPVWFGSVVVSYNVFFEMKYD